MGAHEWGTAGREAFARGGHAPRPADALAGMVATTAPLVVGLVTDQMHAGLIAGLGGMNVALSMGPGRPAERARWGITTLLAGTLVTALATLVHPVGWISVVATVVVVGAATRLGALGRQGALSGFVISAVFVISNGLPGSAGDALAHGAQFLAGSALAVALMMLAGVTDRATAGRAGAIGILALRGAVARHPTLRRYSIILAVTIGATTAAYRLVDLPFGYWIPLTALAVLQPDAHRSRVRLLQRASGTVLGSLAVAAAVSVSASPTVLVGAVAVTSFGLFALRERSYHWLVTLLTPTALLMISTVDFEGSDLAARRIVDTAVGLGVALVVIVVLARLRPVEPSGPGDPGGPDGSVAT